MCNVHRKALLKSHVILDGKKESIGEAFHELSRTKNIFYYYTYMVFLLAT